MKQYTMVKFTPSYEVPINCPMEKNETVLYLGPIANAPGHCAVAKKDGAVIWMVHPQDFTELEEEEI